MADEKHIHDDGRDDTDINVVVEPRQTPLSPSDDTSSELLSATGIKFKFSVVNEAMIRAGERDEGVVNCQIILGDLLGSTNRYGNTSIDISTLPDGEHLLRVTAPNTSGEVAGPNLPIPTDVENIWASFDAKIRKNGGTLTSEDETKSVTISAGTVRIGLQPLWMKSNASSPRGATEIDTIVIHHTGSNNQRSDLNALVYSGNVSAHYLIPPNGKTIKLVEEDRRSWHAGYAYWLGSENINSRSIGIEITNSEQEYETEQVTAVVELVDEILQAYPTISPDRVIGHSDTAVTHRDNRPPIRHGRKSGDPSSTFPWEELEKNGWGLVPLEGSLSSTSYGGFFALRPSGKLRSGDNDQNQLYGNENIPEVSGAVAEIQRDLATIGYYVGDIDGRYGNTTSWAVKVFQQHIFSGTRKTDPINSGDGNLDQATAEMVKRVIGEAEFLGS